MLQWIKCLKFRVFVAVSGKRLQHRKIPKCARKSLGGLRFPEASEIAACCYTISLLVVRYLAIPIAGYYLHGKA